MEAPWLASYPAGVPAELDVGETSSVVDIFERSVVDFAAEPAFTNFGVSLTYGELDRLTRAFAAFLQSRGARPGDRIAIMMPNLLQYPVALFGALRAGLTVVNTNPLYTPRELEHQLKDSGATFIVVVENFGHVLEQCLARTPVKTVVLTAMGDLLGFPKSLLVNLVVRKVKKLVPPFNLPGAVPYRQALAEGARASFTPASVGPSDVAFLQYTGGTTGVAKGAMLTHGNMVANVTQSSMWLAPVLEGSGQVVVTALPLYHIFALTANCLTFMRLGARNLLITNPRDIPSFVKDIAKARFTCITGVNTLFNALLNNPDISSVDFSRLKVALGGGMAVQRSVAERWKKLTGVPLLEAYGLTETSPAVCINPLTLSDFNGSIGLPVPGTECCVQDDDDVVLGVGETGELCVRGPQVMAGYWNRPEDTARVIRDGWLHTGDIARMDEQGFFYIVDRKKDMIIVSGFNVYPNEIEDVMASHPDVVEVAAIGVPDERSGEVVKAFVVRRNDGLTEQALRDFCRERLTAYKVPKRVEFRDELPKTNVGKILRRALREEEVARAGGGASA